jgi:hypothetical protein
MGTTGLAPQSKRLGVAGVVGGGTVTNLQREEMHSGIPLLQCRLDECHSQSGS